CQQGIDIVSILPERGSYISTGTKVENIQFDNIVMQNVMQPIYLWMGNDKKGEKPSMYMRSICISNLIADDAGGSYIGGSPEDSIKNVFLSNIHFNITKQIPKGEKFFISVWNSKNPF